jgi:cobalt/nickel transport system permease protein
MHISDGILSGPVLLAGGGLAALGVARGLRAMRDEDLPKTALLTAAFFTASLIRVPLGPIHAHLVLNGLCGLILGWTAFPALLVALLLQASLFQYGGLSGLGVNTCIMALPAVLVRGLLGPALGRARSRRAVTAWGAAAGAGAILLSAALAAGALAASGRPLRATAGLWALAHGPIAVTEALITGGMAAFLARVRPDLLGRDEAAA